MVFLILMIVFRSSLADWNQVPTGSMLPTIVQGDRILVNKMAYDLRIPLTHVSLARFADPERGDIIVFDSAQSGIRLVKRVVGVPGDVIEMRRNQLIVNDIELAYVPLPFDSSQNFIELSEDLLGVEHSIRVLSSSSRRANFGPLRIPAGFYFAMGDNRDNSADSRVIGLIPRDEIIGRARQVVMSVDYDNYFMPRTDRFWQQL